MRGVLMRFATFQSGIFTEEMAVSLESDDSAERKKELLDKDIADDGSLPLLPPLK